MAAKTVTLLSHILPFSSSDQKGKERYLTMLNNLIKGLIKALETGELLAMERNMHAYACLYGFKGVSVVNLIEPLRASREIILERIRNQTIAYAKNGEDPSHLYELQISLFKQVDTLIHQVVETCQTLFADPTPQKGDHFSHKLEEGLLSSIHHSSEWGVLIIDRHLIIRDVNEPYTSMFRITREKLIGRHIDEVFAGDERVRFLQWAVEKNESGYYLYNHDGKWLTVSTSAIYDQGEVCGALAILRHITETTCYVEEMSKREALAAVGQLAAGMAHEIRNPLTSIKGFIQLLREQGDHEHRDSFYKVILMEVERIDGLLNDVLVLARYRNEESVEESFPVMDELFGVVRLLEPEANRRGINLELQLDRGEWLVYGHRARIKQAFLNILKNAFEAMHTKGKIVQVNVKSTVKEIVFFFEDDGPGLTEEIKKNLFLPFYTTKPEGTGLGLSTTKCIIADHGGSIHADNSPSLGGARFEVRLPIFMQ